MTVASILSISCVLVALLGGPAYAGNFNVGSDGDLRNAISKARDGDTITLTNDITLGSNLPTVASNVTFNGGNHTLSGAGQVRGLFVGSYTVVAVNNLTIMDTSVYGGRGGDGYGGGGGGGGAGMGGALFIAHDAHVTLSNVSLQGNRAQGGRGGESLGDGGGLIVWTSGGGGGRGPTGADGGDANAFSSGGGGTGGGGDGYDHKDGDKGGFGGGGGGSGFYNGGAGGFGGGGGGGGTYDRSAGGFLGGSGGSPGGGGNGGSSYTHQGGGGGGGAGLGGAIFVEEGGTLVFSGSLIVSGGSVRGGVGSSTLASDGQAVGSGIFLHGNGMMVFEPGAGQTQTITDAIVDQIGAGGTGANAHSWSLIKNAPGTLILTGKNAYTGGTTVNSGILQGTSDGLQGNILNNAQVIFDQDIDGIYDGGMSGTGSLIKNGNGKLILTSNNVVKGGTTVNGGKLAVNGQLTSNVTVNWAGMLMGSGHVVGNITNNGGRVVPGNSIGHLTVDGDYTHNSGALEIEVNPNGDSDRISIIGRGHKARIKAGTLQVVLATGIYTPNITYRIITTEGAGGEVRFDEITGGVGFLTPKVSVDREHIYLSLVLAPDVLRSAGGSANQQAVGGALEAASASGNLGHVITTIANMSSVQDAQFAFMALSGEVHASGLTAGYDQARQVQTSILTRLREPSRMSPALPAFAQGTYSTAFAADLPGQVLQPAAGALAQATPNHGLWGEGFGSWGRTRSDGNAASLETSTGGFILGADTSLNDTFRVGLAGGFARTSFDVTGRLSSGSNESVFGAIYGSGQWGAINVRLGASYAWHDIDTSRTVLFPGFADAVSASYDGSTMQGFGEVGYRLDWGHVSLEPFVGASILRLHTDAFQEQGGFSALTGASQDQNLATTTVGVRGEAQVLTSVPLLFKGLLGWRHAYGDVQPDMLMAFAGGASVFSVSGLPVDRNALVAEAGLDWQASEDLSLGVAYRGQIGTKAQDHALTGNLTWRFTTR